MYNRSDMAKTQTVSTVRVERFGLGTTTINPNEFRRIVTDAVRPIREGRTDIPDQPYDTLAKQRKAAVRRGTLAYLSQTGDLFPTE